MMNSTLNAIYEEADRRLVFVIALLIAVGTLGNVLFTVLSSRLASHSSSIALTVIIGVLNILFAYHVHHGRFIAPIKVVLQIMAIIGPTVRIYHTGGVHSPIFFVMFAMAVLTFALYGGRAAAAYSVFIIATFFVMGNIEIPAFELTQSYMISVAVTGVLIAIGTMLSFTQRIRRVEALAARLEKEEASRRLVERYRHEINNPLAIIVATTEKVRMKGLASGDLERIEKCAMRISSMLDEFSNFDRSNSLSELVERNEFEIDYRRAMPPQTDLPS